MLGVNRTLLYINSKVYSMYSVEIQVYKTAISFYFALLPIQGGESILNVYRFRHM